MQYIPVHGGITWARKVIDDLRSKNGAKVRMPPVPRLRNAWIDYAHAMHAASDPDLPILLIDNVAKHFYEESDQEHWRIDRDFPNIAPPFKTLVEFKMARIIHVEKKATPM